MLDIIRKKLHHKQSTGNETSQKFERMETRSIELSQSEEAVQLQDEQKEGLESSTEYESIPKNITAPVIGILGAKGGVGSTTIAINLAATMNGEGLDAPLADLNLQQPDVALMLGKQPQYTLSELISRKDRMDKHVLDACREQVNFEEGSLSYLAPPVELSSSLEIDPEDLISSIEQVSRLTDLVLLDLPKSLDSALVGLLDITTHLVLVTEPTLVSLAASRRWLATLVDLDYDMSKVMIIINRAGGKMRHLDGEAKKLFADHKCWNLPNVYGNLEESILQAEPIVFRYPKDTYSRAIKKLGADLKTMIDRRARAMEEANV